MRYRELRETLRLGDGSELGAGASAFRVREAEDAIGILPETYRSFVLEYGWACLGPYEIYGLGDDIPPHLDLVTVTLSERHDGGLSPDLIPIMNDGGGNLFCVEAVLAVGLSGSIKFWDHETRSQVALAEGIVDFSDWLLRLLAP